MRCTREHRRATPSAVAGLIIVAIGVILLLDRLGILRAGDVLWYWPVGLVALGLAKLFRGRDGGARVWGGILAIAGGVILLHRAGYFRFDWSLFWPLIIIAVGLSLLAKALAGRAQQRAPNMLDVSVLNEWTVFGGGRLISNAPDFQGGEVLAVFGGYEIDLTKAGLSGNEVVLQVNAIFGGIDIRVPETWSVLAKGVPVFGGFEDKTSHPKAEDTGSRLIVKGLAIFGGVEIRN